MSSRFEQYLNDRRPKQSPLIEAALALKLPVFPCNARKEPLTRNGFKDASTDPAEIRRMFAHPEAVMIGVPTGALSGFIVVDVDIKNNQQGMDWLNANSHRMVQTRTIRTASGGLHLYFRTPAETVKNSQSKIAPGIDVRGHGGYVIVPPSPGYAVADTAPIAEVPDWLMPALCPPEPVYTPPPTRMALPPLTSGGTSYGLAALNDECDAMRSAAFGSQERTLNEACLKIGALVAGGEIDDGLALAELLSACRAMPSQPGRNVRKDEQHVRRSYGEGKLRPRAAEPRAIEPTPDLHPAHAFLARITAKSAEAATKPLPVSGGLLDVQGVLKLFLDAATATAIRPQPFLALGVAICVVGTLAGRRYRTATDLRTNIYVAAIAESGGGKDHAPEIARRAIDAAGLGHYLGGETIASGRAILSSVEGHPAKLFQVDEFGLFLSSVTGPKAAGHKAEIWSELMKLYSRAKGTYRGTEYANQKENPRIDVVQPCVSFYGTSTPSTFWSALAGGAMSDGSLARFLLFQAEDNRPPRNAAAGIFKPSDALLDGLRSIASGYVPNPMASGVGNLGMTFVAPMSAEQDPEPHTVLMTADAEAAHARGLADEDTWALKVAGTPQAAIVNRLGENAAKLALISAISRAPHNPTIEASDVQWGWKLAEHCARSLLQDAERHIADTDYERKVNKALDIVRKHGPLTDRQMFERHGWRLSGRERADVLRDLIGVGLVVAIPSDPAAPGRPTVKYAAADGAA